MNKEKDNFVSDITRRFLEAVSRHSLNGYRINKDIPAISQQSFGRIVKGKNEVSLEILGRVCSQYGISTQSLITGTEEKGPIQVQSDSPQMAAYLDKKDNEIRLLNQEIGRLSLLLEQERAKKMPAKNQKEVEMELYEQ